MNEFGKFATKSQIANKKKSIFSQSNAFCTKIFGITENAEIQTSTLQIKLNNIFIELAVVFILYMLSIKAWKICQTFLFTSAP